MWLPVLGTGRRAGRGDNGVTCDDWSLRRNGVVDTEPYRKLQRNQLRIAMSLRSTQRTLRRSARASRTWWERWRRSGPSGVGELSDWSQPHFGSVVHQRPRAHRRAISTAYYALFHRLALDTARNVLPSGAAGDQYAIARYVSHASDKAVCEWVGGNTPPTHLLAVVQRLRSDPDVTDVSQAFLRLYVRREAADYDHAGSFDKKTTLLDVALARRAVSLSFSLRDSENFRTFAGLVALRLNVDRRS